ncbi:MULTISPECIES: peptidylprolyl isomerase [unclassified Variovorax]|jgi:peptidyl-prolyl cis-trans isomerase SurA|uniref:peptidylprolyl isomerase n=1 Tax=unclassified Variovorax TaxID=663243 RepID=UPI0008E212D6|nr:MULTISPECIES: peptidylprolyl isomerase [unclassified Variovorax]TAJ67950.1 MAG: molecular chaperone SurA [Variovorax sp.]SFO59193.1 periplasmic chaperone for outer membrane proteins SurA [Variovorax sp. PDC80]
MKHIRSILSLACLAALAATAGAQQGFRSGGGITDIMRAGPRLAPPAARPAAPAAPVQRSAEFIVALVNSEPITNTEVLTRVQRLIQENPDAERVPRPELGRMVLERLISERAQLQLAKETGIKVDEIAIDQAEQTVARQNQLTLPELRQRVAAEGISLQAFRNDLRDQLLLTRLRGREVDSKVKVSDAEADQFLQDQRNSGGKGDPSMLNLNLAQLLVAVPENATDAQVAQAQQKAQGLAQRARAGEDFSKLVQSNSDAPDRANGGALGMRTADRYPPLFVEAVQSTAVGGIVGPVRSSAGFHVVKVIAKEQVGSADAVVTQTHARHILLQNDPKRTTEQAVAQLAEFKRRIEASGGSVDFASLARDNSQDGSAKDGGDLGWARPGMYVPEFEEAMNRLAPGQISDPVVSRFGVHLIQVLERRNVKPSQDEQREAARAVLRDQRTEEAFNTWAQEVRARAYVEFREPPQS